VNDPEWYALASTLPADVRTRHAAEEARLASMCRKPWEPGEGFEFIPEREIVNAIMQLRRDVAAKLAADRATEYKQ
jgi:hypothetical protein